MLKWPDDDEVLPIEDILLTIEAIEAPRQESPVATAPAAWPTNYTPPTSTTGASAAAISTRDLKAAGVGALVVVLLAGLARWFSREVRA